jgi:hypothetical protein
MTYETATTERLTTLAERLGLGQVCRSDSDCAGRYLLNRGTLPLTGLGWTRHEAEATLRELAARAEVQP